ncbi:hypothetical protein FJD34_15350 [Pseudomonas brenneri]|uniref:Uncharacterized protein n=1 Tax=Pseudomonas brenneri TaxID=129817 RepID=A0A5B2V289_9PSED|nr:hypothetical protein F1720_03630 [Pseudomonas brenneri]TWR78053.1 hypothetical protein FJD34_15350 [Pseudomonas brenneri]
MLKKPAVAAGFFMGDSFSAVMTSVGAGLPAKIVNDNAGCLTSRGALGFFAGKPAPTVISSCGAVRAARSSYESAHPAISRLPRPCPSG